MSESTNDTQEFKKLLRETQHFTGLSQREFSVLLGISPRTLLNWLTDVYSVSSLKIKGVRLMCYAIKQSKDYPVKKAKTAKA